MVRMIAPIFLLFCLLFNLNAQASGNPGRTAMNCVSVSTKTKYDDRTYVYFRNTCNRQIFVIYCGDLKYSRKRCGDGPRGHYFTHSMNLKPGSKYDITIRRGGRYRYGACVGGVGFGTTGFESYSGGRFRCTKTGSYARNERRSSSGSSSSSHYNNYNNNRYNNHNNYNHNRNSYNHKPRTYHVSAYGRNRYASSRYDALKTARYAAKKEIYRYCRNKGYRYVKNLYVSSRNQHCRSSGYNHYYCNVTMKGTCYR